MFYSNNNVVINKNSNFKISDNFSSQEFNQSDFGHIYFNLPKETKFPKTTEELADTLKLYNKKGEKVTIRNTGHSVNGQTLTNGVQVNIGNIKKLSFNNEKMEITAGAGNSWHEVLRAIGFPKNCLPVFPNNPKQGIHIGGTAAVGGIGPYSSKHGGFWNHVVSLKLVTMEGEVIECSRTKNTDFFYFSLGGFGRIGVISEITVKVIPSKTHVLGISLHYHNKNAFYQDFYKIIKDPLFDAIITQEQLSGSNFFSKFFLNKIAPHSIGVLTEIEEDQDLSSLQHQILSKFRKHIPLYAHGNNRKDHEVDLNFRLSTHTKQDLVYYYPELSHGNQLDLCHPWSDFIIRMQYLPKLIAETRRIVRKYKMEKYLIKDSMLHGPFNMDVMLAYVIKNIEKHTNQNFPLTLDFADSDFSMVLGVMTTVPSQEVGRALAMTNELTEVVYGLNGKRYLYGIHNLTEKQVEIQFGKETISKWNKLKDKLDPKHLLNNGVIPHLDE